MHLISSHTSIHILSHFRDTLATSILPSIPMPLFKIFFSNFQLMFKIPSIHPSTTNPQRNTQYANQNNSPIPSIPTYLQILPCLTNPTQDKIRAYQNCTVPPFNSIQQHRELPHTTLFICKLQVLTSSHLPKENITTAIHPMINTMPKAFIQTTSFSFSLKLLASYNFVLKFTLR